MVKTEKLYRLVAAINDLDCGICCDSTPSVQRFWFCPGGGASACLVYAARRGSRVELGDGVHVEPAECTQLFLGH